MFNIKNILSRRNDQARNPESSRLSEETVGNNASSAEGFLCPHCFLAFPSDVTLQNHYESSHSDDINNVSGEGRDRLNCPACKMKLGSEIELQSHYARHHSEKKEELEIEAMSLQVKALEEGKALLQSELQAVRTQSSELLKENVKIREERNGLELKAAKLAGELADLKADMDELKTKKVSVESALKLSEEKIKKLEVEIQQRPEADDVSLLQQEIVSVQKMMDQLTLQREAEKDTLQKQCNVLQEKCLKLQSEKTELESLMRTYPKREEIESLQGKISEMSMTISQLQRNLDLKDVEKEKLQISLEKYVNYEEIKVLLAEKKSELEKTLKASMEKDACIVKLQDELKSSKESIEAMKAGREKLFSKIEEGEGASVAILQLKEENARLQEQFVRHQTMYGQAINDNESKIEELQLSLKKTLSDSQSSKEKYSEIESELVKTQKKLLDLQTQKDSLSEEFNLKIANLTATSAADKARINNLEKEVHYGEKLLEEKELAMETLQKDLKEKKISKFYVPDISFSHCVVECQEKSLNAKIIEKIKLERKDFEKRLADLANTLPLVQADLMEKEKKLGDAEKKLLRVTEHLASEKESRSKVEKELKSLTDAYEEAKLKLKSLESAITESEESKAEFCDKISSLNEELLKSQLKESELSAALDNMNESKSHINEKCFSLEEENRSLRSSVTSLQNEKNSLLSELEKIKKAVSDLSELCAVQEKEIKELTDSCQKEKNNSEKVLKDFNLAKDIYLKDKVQLQKQIENLENDCAKQLSQIQQTVKSLENQLEEAEERNVSANSSLEEAKKLLKQKELEWDEKESHHVAQVGVLSENIKTLREDLSAEQKRRETLEQKLDEVSGTKLELEAKLENALDERRGLLERCLKSEAECERMQKSTAEMRRKYEDCVAALQELGRENQTLQVENMKHITRKWADDSEVTHCTACGKLFTVTIRKHHCRNCGNIFCNECSAKTATVASSKKPVRVCDVCYSEVTK